jgi:thiamine biosynthesis protein ThiI
MKGEKVVCLVSGGIDSPVACALAARRFEIIPLHFCLYPYTCEDSFLVAMNSLRDLKSKTKFEKAVVIPWARILRKILGGGDKSYACLECRKGMFIAAEAICEREGASGIVTGESLGQKASQTLENMAATSAGIKFPILRPLLGFDKIEVERLSKKLGLWHDMHAGCCYATPKHPRTRADPKAVDAMLTKLGIDEMISTELENALEVRTFEEDFKAYLEKLA